MYEMLAKRITKYFISKKIIQEDKREIYEYGYEIMISLVFYILFLLFVAIIFGLVIESIAFILGFFLCRKISGGYHSDTYLKCHILSIVNQIIFIICLLLIPDEYRFITSLIVVMLSTIILFVAAPIDHPNKRFSEKEHFRYKLLSRVFAIILPVTLCIIYYTAPNSILSLSFYIGVFSANISLLYAYLKRRLPK